jgi:hypothetical protein
MDECGMWDLYYVTFFNYHYHRGEYEEALAAAQKWNSPNFYWNQVGLVQAYAQLGRKEEAPAAVKNCSSSMQTFPRRRGKSIGYGL